MTSALYEWQIQVAFADGPFATAPTWTDISAYVRLSSGISYSRGQQDENSGITPGQLSFTVNNDDGRFSVGRATLSGGGANPYHPLKLRCPVRLRVRYPFTSGSWYTIWTGAVDSWGNGTVNGYRGQTQVTATDVWSLLGRKMRALLYEEVLYDSPAAYYPLGEASGSTTAGDLTGTYQSMKVGRIGTGSGAVDFGGGSLSADALTGASFTPGSSSNGKTLALPGQRISGVKAVEAVLRYTAGASTGRPILLIGSSLLWVYADTSSGVTTVTEGTSVLLTGTSDITDGNDHHIAYIRDDGAGNSKLVVDGVVEATGASASGLTVDGGGLGGDPTNGTFEGRVSNFALHTSAITSTRMAAHASAAFDTAETTGARWTRLATLGDATSAVVGTPSSTVQGQPTADRSLSELFAEVATSEAGRAYMAEDGTVTLRARSELYGYAPSTVSIAAKAVGPGFESTYDDQRLVNDVTVTRTAGATQRYTDASSVSSYGTYERSEATVYADDDQSLALAQWLVNNGKTPSPRSASVEVDLVTKAASITETEWFAPTIGSMLQVTSLPAAFPASSALFFIEGLSGQIGTNAWTVTLNVTPLGLHQSVWLLDVLSTLDTSTLLAL